ncbi:MAG: FhaA domain-containing protein [Actinomycetota bacterium]
MGVAKGIEQRLEGLVEGFFAKVFRSGLQPIEVGRRILREMADGKTLSVNRVYAPNEFHVIMGSDDYERFSQMEAGLAREFGELVIDSAKENRWNLMGIPSITFEEDPAIGKGEFRVEASFAAPPDEEPKARVSTHEPDPQDPSITGAISLDAAERFGVASANPQLLVLGENGKPTESISVTRDPVVIGRLSTNDVVLSDPNVSRRHAELRREGGRWMLVDLGSTNGSVVNGRLVKEHPLEDGDRLSFGQSELIFKEAAE